MREKELTTEGITNPEIDLIKTTFETLLREVSKTIVGYETIIKQVFTCLLCGGHALIEGVPGLGKTKLVKSLAGALDLKYSRIQFTPDLMPADIIGTNIISETETGQRSFEFFRGPVFGQIVLADEINRATPKTQSALLEAMQEGRVTVFGKEYQLDQPFTVLATQNPIEMEGTYPLPEAQVDRFLFKLKVEFPGKEDLLEILEKTTEENSRESTVITTTGELLKMMPLVKQVPIASNLKDYVARLILASHNSENNRARMVREYVRYGASPRGAQALVLAAKVVALLKGRYNVAFEDIKEVAVPALRHRIILNLKGEAEGIDPDDIIRNILGTVSEN
ncbi:MoxR family ATPase [bacterium]|nr:MoxR family ATPase [bacterium]